MIKLWCHLQVSLSAFAFLFSELVQYCQNRVESISDLEKKLEEAGYGIGQRLIELIGCRDRLTKRETRLVNMLQFVSNVVWRHLFNKGADNLEKSMENEDECKSHCTAIIVWNLMVFDFVTQI